MATVMPNWISKVSSPGLSTYKMCPIYMHNGRHTYHDIQVWAYTLPYFLVVPAVSTKLHCFDVNFIMFLVGQDLILILVQLYNIKHFPTFLEI